MLGRFRVTIYGEKLKYKSQLYTLASLKKCFEIIPVVFIQACSLIGMPLMMAHRAFVTTIDVQLTSYQRFEIPSVPRFFDLRKPRSLKFITFAKVDPAIHLDNRYRLMRNEPMLDADGKETDRIGDDC
ncbi:uncharacterized protein [Linepithema humile]|uniref:uncharacterized protein isoform X2 n=1 Tax=Linepithema humile TaxID=83485 RepID=UPI00351DCE62